MAKKSRSSGKVEPKTSGEEETQSPVREMNVPIPSGGIIDFYYLFTGIGILIAIIFIIVGLLRYVFHIL
jgi:hypothetical protein